VLLTIKKTLRSDFGINKGDILKISFDGSEWVVTKSLDGKGCIVSPSNQFNVSDKLLKEAGLIDFERIEVISRGGKMVLIGSNYSSDEDHLSRRSIKQRDLSNEKLEADRKIRTRSEIAAAIEVGTGKHNFLARVELVSGKTENWIINTNESITYISETLKEDSKISRVIYIVNAEMYKIM